MSDKIQKFLRKLSDKQRQEVEQLIKRIVVGEVAGLDMKKLRGGRDVYRIRKGDVRIIYQMSYGEARILAIERRSDTTYRDF